MLRKALLVGGHVGEDGEQDERELQQEAQNRQEHLRGRWSSVTDVWTCAGEDAMAPCGYFAFCITFALLPSSCHIQDSIEKGSPAGRQTCSGCT